MSSKQDEGGMSAELRVTKVAITNVSIWLMAWTPFVVVAVFAMCGRLDLITPLNSQLPSCLAKIASCINPLVFAISHPK